MDFEIIGCFLPGITDGDTEAQHGTEPVPTNRYILETLTLLIAYDKTEVYAQNPP